ncbi:helix-turn-helix domain-containing protein [Streptomyces sp. 4N509B]|uniref:helix-turn-helix domain-containing protein n=1 Tax=Streptomyces sp. 4N509B TaxID=3457413 RepID=UPI003FD50B2A
MGSALPRLVLGQRLRELREAAGVSRAKAAWAIRGSESKMSRLERGRCACKPRDVADLLSLYQVTDEQDRATLLALAAQANAPVWWQEYADVIPPWFESYLGMEQAAHVVRGYEVQFVPGLLQTPDYARAVIQLSRPGLGAAEGGGRAIRRGVELRMLRQRVLHRPSDPARLWMVIDEAVLCRPVTNAAAHRAQLRHLLEVSEQPHVTVQVMPFTAGGHAAGGGPLSIVRLPGGTFPDVVYLEQLNSAVYPSKPAEVEEYRHVMNSLCVKAAEPHASRDMIHRVLREV